MNDLLKNLQTKNYNPCGTLTGREIIICDLARKNYFDLPYIQVMRNIVIPEIAENKKILHEAEIISWADRNLNSQELQASFDFNSVEFQNFSAVEKGLCKYFIHILFENRYNIFYNRLVDYCHELDEKLFENVSFDVLEKKINSLAGEGNYSMTLNNLTDEFLNFIMS